LGRKILATSKYGINRLQARLGKRGLIILGGAVIVAGLALNWSWLVAIGLAPLLLTALPCVVMCAVGVCMMPKNEKSIVSDLPETDMLPRDTPSPMVRTQSDRNT
jgi:4-hydroxybenzoate polyprenyltransferase